MKKVYIVGPQIFYADWIDNKTIVENQEDADIVMFTGGCDVNPAIYNCKKHPTTWYNRNRDIFEVEAFYKVRPDQLCVGTCRGAQLFTALFGGKLVQDVTGHAGSSHGIKLVSEKFKEVLPEESFVTSLHHQMMYPYEINPDYYDILYTSTSRRSEYYEGDGIDPSIIIDNGEPEVVLYHLPDKPVCLGIQGHPEMMHSKEGFVRLLNKLITLL